MAVRKAFDDTILAEFARTSGIAVHAVFEPTSLLVERTRQGMPFDVLLGVAGALDDLAPGAIDTTTREIVVATRIGLAVPAKARAPRIDSLDNLVATLRGARSVAYSRHGASGRAFAEHLVRWGISDEINAKATVVENGFVAETLLDGRADVAVQQLSELAFVPAVQIVGALPGPAGQPTPFAAAIHAAATGPTRRAAERFIAYLKTPAAALAFEASGMEPAITTQL